MLVTGIARADIRGGNHGGVTAGGSNGGVLSETKVRSDTFYHFFCLLSSNVYTNVVPARFLKLFKLNNLS